MDNFLKQVESIGFCGVQNFPTVGLFDGNFRQNLEETGMGYGYDSDYVTESLILGFYQILLLFVYLLNLITLFFNSTNDQIGGPDD